MKRLGLCVFLLTACEAKDSAPQASKQVQPADVPPVSKSTTFVAPTADAAVAPTPDAAAAPAKQPDAVALEEEAARYAEALFAEGDSDDSMGKMDPSRKPGADLGQQINDAKADGSKEPRIGDGGSDVGARSGGAVGAPDIVTDRISLASKKALDDTSLAVEQVVSKVLSSYMAGMKRCYKEALKVDPTVVGKMTMAFTVTDKGRVSDPNATGPVEALDACIEAQMAKWSFPVPKDADGEPTRAGFELIVQLRTD